MVEIDFVAVLRPNNRFLISLMDVYITQCEIVAKVKLVRTFLSRRAGAIYFYVLVIQWREGELV